jgi:hypothetical protein
MLFSVPMLPGTLAALGICEYVMWNMFLGDLMSSSIQPVVQVCNEDPSTKIVLSVLVIQLKSYRHCDSSAVIFCVDSVFYVEVEVGCGG